MRSPRRPAGRSRARQQLRLPRAPRAAPRVRQATMASQLMLWARAATRLAAHHAMTPVTTLEHRLRSLRQLRGRLSTTTRCLRLNKFMLQLQFTLCAARRAHCTAALHAASTLGSYGNGNRTTCAECGAVPTRPLPCGAPMRGTRAAVCAPASNGARYSPLWRAGWCGLGTAKGRCSCRVSVSVVAPAHQCCSCEC